MGRRTPRKKSAATPGVFENGSWRCDCNLPLSAVRLQVKKKGRNHGRWFFTCQRLWGAQCEFFQWDDASTPNRRDSGVQSSIVTTIGQGSPPLPDLTPTGTRQLSSPISTPSRVRIPRNSPIQTPTPRASLSTQSPQIYPTSSILNGSSPRSRSSAGLFVDDSDDYDDDNGDIEGGGELELKHGLDNPADREGSFLKKKRPKMENGDDEYVVMHDSSSRTVPEDLFGDLSSEEEAQMAQITDLSQSSPTQNRSRTVGREVAPAATETTPSSRQWGPIVGMMPTPNTGQHTGQQPTKQSKTSQNPANVTPSSVRRGSFSQDGSGSESQNRGGRGRDDDDYDVTAQVMKLLEGQPIPDSVRKSVRDTLDMHALRARGVKRGRDMARAALRTRNAEVAELRVRVGMLEDERRERTMKFKAALAALNEDDEDEDGLR